LVWQDNATDGSGLGISALPLNDSFTSFQSRFRVNQRTGGDQERPQVVVFPNGGAAFVWQGGLLGIQHIYARFLSPSNTWLGPDVRVSSPTSNFQINPSIALLTNGNVVITWGSYNQFSSSSMQDVYGQILSPAGQKIGPEFLVNQFTSYNQRTPSVAALPTGGFVVAWVSEQERTQVTDASDQLLTADQLAHPTVDVYGRVFDSSATPVTDEFLVNTSSDVCANPRVAASSDGSFQVVWGQRPFTLADNGWDIFARAFSNSTPASAAPVITVNTTLLSDQYVPEIAALGSNYLAAWTSYGQDGDREGVYARFLSSSGSPSSDEFRVNTSTASRQMQPAVASDGSARFLAVWTSFNGIISGFDLFAQTYASSNSAPSQSAAAAYGAPASDPFPVDSVPDPYPSIPSRPSLFAGGERILEYPAGLGIASSNTFAPFKGNFSGLFYDTNGVTPLSAGYFTVLTTLRGNYTAKITLGKRTYAFSGRLDTTGSASKVILRPGLASLKVQFQVVGDQILGTILAGSWTADIIANRQVPAAVKSSTSSTQAGPYTFIIPPDTNAAVGPAGFSFGSIKVDSLGNLRWAGSLADGTRIAQKSSISKDGLWPLYSPLYSGSGSLIGWIQFGINQPNSDLGGQVIWIRPHAAVGRGYSGGFTNEVWASGSLYSPPARGSSPLNLGGGSDLLTFAGAGLSFSNSFSLDDHNRIRSSDGSKLTLTFTPSSGLFRGSVLKNGRTLSFQGALFQDTSSGYGFFLNLLQSGSVSISPAP
jgi:hypothetical protein